MRSEIIATMACHSAIRAGQSLDKVEMVALLEQMDEFPLSSFCPHGRPVFVEYPIKKLEREFGRTI
jgi:DNA mismatch repair protein MutL